LKKKKKEEKTHLYKFNF